MDEQCSADAGIELLRRFGPAEVGLSDDALLDRADRAYRLLRACEWSVELREAREDRAERDLTDMVAELACRLLHPPAMAKDNAADASLTPLVLAAEAERLHALRKVSATRTNRARSRLAFAQGAWKAVAAEMVRRFLKPPATAVEVKGAGRSFRLWLDDDGEPVVAVRREAHE